MVTVRFGVLGATSVIASQAVIPAIRAVDGAELAVVASHSDPDALARWGVRVVDDYDAVVGAPDVDVVYVPLPNHLHLPWVERAAAAGNHVLCEKPLGRSEAEAAAMRDACEAAGVVGMEAYMSPYHPRNAALATWLADGGLGRLRAGHARFTGTLPADNHRWRLGTGGGALLDLGIYCLEPLLQAGGWPVEAWDDLDVVAAAQPGGDGVDATCSGWLVDETGVSVSFTCSHAGTDGQVLELLGERASVTVDRAFTPQRGVEGLAVTHADGRAETLPTDTGDCYEGMVAELVAAIATGRPVARGLDRSVALARLLDRVRAAAAARTPDAVELPVDAP